jgi:hypothetical protein
VNYKQKSSSHWSEASEDASSAREIFIIYQNYLNSGFPTKRSKESLGNNFRAGERESFVHIIGSITSCLFFFINLLLNLLKSYFISNTFCSYEMILSGFASLPRIMKKSFSHRFVRFNEYFCNLFFQLREKLRHAQLKKSFLKSKKKRKEKVKPEE